MTRDKWERLSDDEKRTKVAGLCGWLHVAIRTWYFDDCGTYSRNILTGFPTANHVDYDAYEPIPDYLNDLNKMHEAEELMFAGRSDRSFEYEKLLRELCMEPHRATASQRAEALVLTIEAENKGSR